MVWIICTAIATIGVVLVVGLVADAIKTSKGIEP